MASKTEIYTIWTLAGAAVVGTLVWERASKQERNTVEWLRWRLVETRTIVGVGVGAVLGVIGATAHVICKTALAKKNP